MLDAAVFLLAMLSMPWAMVMLACALETIYERIVRRLEARRRDSGAEPVPAHDADVFVTLVHGTFARSASWTLPGSLICQVLRRRFKERIHIERFAWSGRNSLPERVKAARGLAELLDATTRHPANSRHFIIAHSHGGAIALDALRHFNLAGRIEGVVCLSTPFIHMRPRQLGDDAESLVTALPVIAGLMAIYLSAFLLDDPRLVTMFLFIPAMIAGIMIWKVLGERARNWMKFLDQTFSQPVVKRERVLLVRTPQDEATLGIGVFSLANWILARAWALPSAAVGATWRMARGGEQAAGQVFVFIAWAVVFAGVLALPTLGLLERDLQSMLIITAGWWGFLLAALWRTGHARVVVMYIFAVSAALLLSPFMLLTFALMLLPFGPSLALAAMYRELSVESAPPGRWNLVQFSYASGEAALEPPQADGPLLSHSLAYDDTHVLQYVCDWMEERLVGLPEAG